MRKLALVAVTVAFAAFGCATDEPTVQEPPDETAEATPETNDQGSQTFESEDFSAEIELDDFYFKPTFIKSPGGGTAKLTLHNEGDAVHTFTSEALGVDEEVEPGKEKEIEVEIGTETRYEFHCRFHQAQGMRGAFQPH